MRAKWSNNKLLNRIALLLLLLGFAYIFMGRLKPLFDIVSPKAKPQSRFDCKETKIIDGDTFLCGEAKIRIKGIDAPELPGHCNKGRECVEGDPFAAKDKLQSLLYGKIECEDAGRDKYGRTLGNCFSGKTNIACEMVKSGNAVERYSKLDCE